eukprot:TRINITY_DN7697_c1_g1_i1.p1 TRINITY_DN7697_c1_g1~~TRINITY_DN7697_c1_g1_i1.p1  ORF type:complete len:1012 (+),score=226.47 TRINITY_DN7697_c1_g1_i1:61-3036(+)
MAAAVAAAECPDAEVHNLSLGTTAAAGGRPLQGPCLHREATVIRIELLGPLGGWLLVVCAFITVFLGGVLDFVDASLAWHSVHLQPVGPQPNHTGVPWSGEWKSVVEGLSGSYLSSTYTQWKYTGERPRGGSFTFNLTAVRVRRGRVERRDHANVRVVCSSHTFFTSSYCASVILPTLGRGARLPPSPDADGVQLSAYATGLPDWMPREDVQVTGRVRDDWFDYLQLVGRWLIIIAVAWRFYRFRMRCRLAMAPTRPEHDLCQLVIALLVVGANPFFALGFLRRSTSDIINLIVDILLFHFPYLSPWLVQGAVWGGLFGLLKGPVAAGFRVFGWVLFNLAADIAFACVTGDASVSVDEGYARALFALAHVDSRGYAAADVETGTLAVAIIYTACKALMILNLIGLLLLPSWWCWGPRRQLRSLPYQRTRDRQLGLRFLQIIAAALVVQILLAMGLSSAGPSLGYASAGGVLTVTLTVCLIQFAYSPVWLCCGEAGSTPPEYAPYDDTWMRIRWEPKWVQWVMQQHGALSLYVFATEEQRLGFWRLQEVSEGDRDTEDSFVVAGEGLYLEQFSHQLFTVERATRMAVLSYESYFDESVSANTAAVAASLLVVASGAAPPASPRLMDEPRGAAVLAAMEASGIASLASSRSASPLLAPPPAKPQERLARDLEAAAFTLVRAFTARGVQCFVCSEPAWRAAARSGGCRKSAPGAAGTAWVIAFRGTANLRNVRDDLAADRVAWPEACAGVVAEEYPESPLGEGSWVPDADRCMCGGRMAVQRGFAAVWRALGPLVIGAVQRYVQPGQPVCVTGHSLGGAVSCLCAYTLAGIVDGPVSLLTFGAPMVGNAAFARALDRAVPEHFRCVNEDDIITRGRLRCGNEHAGREVLLRLQGRVIACSPPWIERWLRPAEQCCSCGFIAHGLGDYLLALCAVAEEMGATEVRRIMPPEVRQALSRALDMSAPPPSATELSLAEGGDAAGVDPAPLLAVRAAD